MNDDQTIRAAAAALADKWDDHMLADAVGPRLTCAEVAPLLDLLKALGKTHAAESWEQMHGQGDDDEYDEHHDIYKKMLEEIPPCICPTWDRIDTFDSPKLYAAAVAASGCSEHGTTVAN